MSALTWDEFAGAEGATYQVDREGEPCVEMTLERMVDLPPAARAAGSFRLEFRRTLEPTLPEQIYPFRSGEACSRS